MSDREGVPDPNRLDAALDTHPHVPADASSLSAVQDVLFMTRDRRAPEIPPWSPPPIRPVSADLEPIRPVSADLPSIRLDVPPVGSLVEGEPPTDSD